MTGNASEHASQKRWKKLGVKHVKSRAYNTSSNGGAELIVHSIKEFLRKENNKKITQELLQELTFKVNNYVQNEKTDSAAERWFRRKPINMLPNTMERDIDWKNMPEERRNEQTKLATKKGRKSSVKFRIRDKVILQETTGKKRQLLETGVIKEQRVSDNGTFHSFNADLDKGGQCLRNKRLLKHYRQVTFTNRNDEVTHDPPYMNTRSRGPIH